MSASGRRLFFPAESNANWKKFSFAYGRKNCKYQQARAREQFKSRTVGMRVDSGAQENLWPKSRSERVELLVELVA